MRLWLRDRHSGLWIQKFLHVSVASTSFIITPWVICVCISALVWRFSCIQSIIFYYTLVSTSLHKNLGSLLVSLLGCHNEWCMGIIFSVIFISSSIHESLNNNTTTANGSRVHRGGSIFKSLSLFYWCLLGVRALQQWDNNNVPYNLGESNHTHSDVKCHLQFQSAI